MLFFKKISLLIFFIPLSLYGSEKCIYLSFDHLDFPKTEANYCPTCDKNNTSSKNNFLNPIPTSNCFNKIVNQSIYSKKHTFCEEGSPPPQTKKGNYSICPSDKYALMTSQVFKDVTHCLGIKNPTYFLALINRESKFQITARSPTGASCYGQLTGIAIQDINLRLYELHQKHATNKKSCERIYPHMKKFDISQTKRKNQISYTKPPTTLCAVHSNPYSCMFLSGIYYKNSLDEAEKLFNDLKIVIAKTHSKKSLVFKDNRSYENYIAIPKNKKKIKSIRKISLVQNPEAINQILAYTSYNGGPGTTQNYFESYITNIKHKLWNKDKNIQKETRKKIFGSKPVGIPSNRFLHNFSQHIKSRGASSEMSTYSLNVLKDFQNIVQKKKVGDSCGFIPFKNLLKHKSF